MEAQSREFLDINQIKAGINASGDLFNNYDNFNSLFEVPAGSGKTAIYAASLWIGGYNDQGILHTAAQTYRQSGTLDFWAGPVAKYYDEVYDDRYNRVWKITQTEIETHKSNFKQKGYAIIEAIQTWPAKGNTANNEAENLAPFMDVNHNNKYDPENGDYPVISGDQAIYFIINDSRAAHTSTHGEPLGIEIHGMAYAFIADGNAAFDQTVFVNYKVINRSQNNYHDLYLGLWVDFDLGYAYDDMVGSDSARGMFFVYNGDDNDEGASGYGLKPPVVGVRSLNNKLTGFVTYNNDWSLKGNPSEPQHYYYYLQCKYKNGQKIDPATNYLYPGIFQFTEGYYPGDRRGIGIYGPFSLLSGKSECFDYAFTYARDPNKTHLGNLEILNYLSGEVKKYYNNKTFGCKCPETSVNTENQILTFNIYPTITEKDIRIEIPEFTEKDYSLQITSINGQVVFSKIISNSAGIEKIDLSNLQKGVYFIRLSGEEGFSVKKIIKV